MTPIEKLKQLFIRTEKEMFYTASIKKYDVCREFCIDCEIVTFNEIELMEYEVNFAKEKIKTAKSIQQKYLINNSNS